MDDYIDQIRAAHQPAAYPKSLPNDEQIVQVEEQVYMPMPSDLRAFLLTVSDVICGSLEPVTAADPFEHTYLPEVAALAWDHGMPRFLLPICAFDQGYYYIDPDGGVGRWLEGDEEEGEIEWPNLWEWAIAVWINS
ncbi:SMI1/KNR4 family protein [Celerinatantimonas yamalensis]|uniref:SMI1/KNR4 family protein n=1 Tax=Celerinatantimonas yamalensis TaxID=559956 RepID=A0ABW9GB76_9GAMM